MDCVSRRFCLAALAVLALGLTAAPARAAFVVRAQTIDVAQGGTGYLDVTLTNNGAAAISLSDFSLRILLNGPGVSFTGVDANTADPYVFGMSGRGLPLSNDSFPNTGFVAADGYAFPPGYVDVAAGQTVGLARVAFQVNTGAPTGLRGVTFGSDPSTAFTDQFGATYSGEALSFDDGGVNVTPAAPNVVPVPGSLLLALAGAGTCLLGRVAAGVRRKAG